MTNTGAMTEEQLDRFRNHGTSLDTFTGQWAKERKEALYWQGLVRDSVKGVKVQIEGKDPVALFEERAKATSEFPELDREFALDLGLVMARHIAKPGKERDAWKQRVAKLAIKMGLDKNGSSRDE